MVQSRTKATEIVCLSVLRHQQTRIRLRGYWLSNRAYGQLYLSESSFRELKNVKKDDAVL
jgi:hypothetical protein